MKEIKYNELNKFKDYNIILVNTIRVMSRICKLEHINNKDSVEALSILYSTVNHSMQKYKKRVSYMEMSVEDIKKCFNIENEDIIKNTFYIL